MNKKIGIASVELEGDDGLLVQFTDGTMAGYVVDELLDLRPHREPINLTSVKKGTREDLNQAAARLIRKATERD